MHEILVVETAPKPQAQHLSSGDPGRSTLWEVPLVNAELKLRYVHVSKIDRVLSYDFFSVAMRMESSGSFWNVISGQEVKLAVSDPDSYMLA